MRLLLIKKIINQVIAAFHKSEDVRIRSVFLQFQNLIIIFHRPVQIIVAMQIKIFHFMLIVNQ